MTNTVNPSRYRTVMFQSRTPHPTRSGHAHIPRFGSENSDTHRFGRPFFRWLSDPTRPVRTLPLPTGTGREPFTRLAFWKVDRLRNYETHVPSLTKPRASWFTLLYWQQLLDEFKPEPWAPAVLHYEIDLREPVSV